MTLNYRAGRPVNGLGQARSWVFHAWPLVWAGLPRLSKDGPKLIGSKSKPSLLRAEPQDKQNYLENLYIPGTRNSMFLLLSYLLPSIHIHQIIPKR